MARNVCQYECGGSGPNGLAGTGRVPYAAARVHDQVISALFAFCVQQIDLYMCVHLGESSKGLLLCIAAMRTQISQWCTCLKKILHTKK